MKIVVPGHVYQLDNLKSEGTTQLQFYCDESINEFSLAGPSSQEVLRALIDRVIFLDRQKPHKNNTHIVTHLRQAIGLFESRATELKINKGLAIENLTTGPDGHIEFRKA